MPEGRPEVGEVWGAIDGLVEIIAVVRASSQRKREVVTFVDRLTYYAASLYTDQFLTKYTFKSPHSLRPTEWDHILGEGV